MAPAENRIKPGTLVTVKQRYINIRGLCLLDENRNNNIWIYNFDNHKDNILMLCLGTTMFYDLEVMLWLYHNKKYISSMEICDYAKIIS